MHIAIIDQGEIFGGAEAFTLDLLRYTSKNKVQFTVLHDHEAASQYKEELDLIPFITKQEIYLPSSSPKFFASYVKAMKSSNELKKELKKLQPDLIQTNTVRAHAIGAYAAKSMGIPLVWVMHDMTFPPKFLKKFAHIPAKIVCVSEVVKQYVLQHVPDLREGCIEIIPNGVHPEKITAGRPLKTCQDLDGKEFSFQEGVRYVGLIGRIDTWKGQDVLLQAVNILHREYPQHESIEYLIIGNVTTTSEERQQYYRKLREYQANNYLRDVHFLGHQDARGVLKNLDILVHASTEPEPFGRTIIEAFAAGVPVIASKCGAPQDIVRYGYNGLLFEPRNAQDLAQKISLLLEDNHLVETVKMNAKKEVRAKYHVERVVDSFYDIWRSNTNCS